MVEPEHPGIDMFQQHQKKGLSLNEERTKHLPMLRLGSTVDDDGSLGCRPCSKIVMFLFTVPVAGKFGQTQC